MKAAEARHLLPIVADVWAAISIPGSPRAARIQKMAFALVRGYECFDSGDYRLSDRLRRRLVAAFDEFFREYRMLCVDAINLDIKRWREVPKFHFTQHDVLQSEWQNPRRSWTYPDESFESTLKAVCLKCQAGTPAHAVASKAIRRWARGAALRAWLASPL